MPSSVLVVPGTGKQGSAVARLLLQRGHTVHILTRDQSSAVAQELQSKGAKLHTGSLGSKESIRAASENVDSVFLVVPANPADTDSELVFAENLVDATRANKVKNIVLTTVARTGEHENFPGWGKDFPLAWYWKNKAATEKMVQEAGFDNWTILRPASFNSNFCYPEVSFIFPGLAEALELRLPFHKDTTLDLIDVSTIAEFAVAALESPSVFSGKALPLAAEKLTATQIAEALSKVSGEQISVRYLSDESAKEMIEQGDIMMAARVWQREFGYGVDVEQLKQYGIPLTPLSKALTKEGLGWPKLKTSTEH